METPTFRLNANARGEQGVARRGLRPKPRAAVGRVLMAPADEQNPMARAPLCPVPPCLLLVVPKSPTGPRR